MQYISWHLSSRLLTFFSLSHINSQLPIKFTDCSFLHVHEKARSSAFLEHVHRPNFKGIYCFLTQWEWGQWLTLPPAAACMYMCLRGRVMGNYAITTFEQGYLLWKHTVVMEIAFKWEYVKTEWSRNIITRYRRRERESKNADHVMTKKERYVCQSWRGEGRGEGQRERRDDQWYQYIVIFQLLSPSLLSHTRS